MVEISERPAWSGTVTVTAAAERALLSEVSASIVEQVASLGGSEKQPLEASAGNSIRGVDFYPHEDFMRALIQGAVRFKLTNGYVPRLASPISFNEQIFARMFFAPIPMPSLADKLAARDYVKARLGDKFLPAVNWIGDDISGLIAAKPLTGRYVLKANNGCHFNLFLTLPDDLSAKRDEIRQRATGWLTSRFGYDWGEWHYYTFKPKLFLEEFIDFNGRSTPDDYKFFCFHGNVRLIEVAIDRFTRLRSAFYTPDWKHIPVAYRHAPIQCPRPSNLKDMIHVAEAIAEGMDFVRVDLYSDRKSQIRFGEMTFTPGNGCLRFSDFKFDE
jgi:hypothetical protein